MITILYGFGLTTSTTATATEIHATFSYEFSYENVGGKICHVHPSGKWHRMAGQMIYSPLDMIKSTLCGNRKGFYRKLHNCSFPTEGNLCKTCEHIWSKEGD